MRKQKSCKPLLYLLLTGWCLLFLRCESTEKSMVRAVYLSQTGQGYQAGLLYQAPQAAADAAEASAALQFVQAEGQTMEQALAAAEQALPQTASYRLCDYLLLPKAEEPLLTEYEQLVLRRGCGRTAARLLCAEGETGHLATRAAPAGCSDGTNKGRSTHRTPAVSAYRAGASAHSLVERGRDNDTGGRCSAHRSGRYALVLGAGRGLPPACRAGRYPAALAGRGAHRHPALHRFGHPAKGAGTCAAGLSTRCHSPMPTQAQQQQLAAQCTALLQSCWQQGVDVLHLQAREALRSGSGASFDPTKNACPQWRTDVHFMPY